MTDASPAILGPLAALLRCLSCGSPVELEKLVEPGAYPDLGPDGVLSCTGCALRYPVIAGTARMLRPELLELLHADYPEVAPEILPGRTHTELGGELVVKRQTAESFAYEWEQFGALRTQWRKNFLDYMQPLGADWFAERLVLDVGAGSGRHSHQACELGASVVAVDLGASIDVARANLPDHALTVQADAEQLPFEPGGFGSGHVDRRAAPFAGPGSRTSGGGTLRKA